LDIIRTRARGSIGAQIPGKGIYFGYSIMCMKECALPLYDCMNFPLLLHYFS